MSPEKDDSQSSPNVTGSPEDLTVDQLPEILGFVESEELLALHARVIEAMPSGDEAQIRELMLQYSAEGEKVVDQKQGDDFPRAQVGFLIAKALLWKEAGREDYYPEDLSDALTYADNMGYEDVVPALVAALAEAEGSTAESAKSPGMDPEFAIRAADPIPIEKDLVERALEAGIRMIESPEGSSSKLDPYHLGQLAQAFGLLSAGKIAMLEPLHISAINYDPASMQLEVKDTLERPMPSIPILEAVAAQKTLEGIDKEASYNNVRLAFALTALALSELYEDRQHLSDKAVSSIQASLQKIRELTIHCPLASMAEGLSKIQIAGLLNAINVTITSDPIKAAVWKDKEPLRKALERIKS